MIPVFDGHNDFVQRLMAAGPRAAALWRDGDGTGHLDLPRVRAGGMVGGLFALWIPDLQHGDLDGLLTRMQNPPFALDLPPQVPHAAALPQAFAQAAHLLALDRAGLLRLCRSAADIRAAMVADRIAAVLHMEGAEAIRDMDALHLWHAAGLRSLGPVWSRPTAYGHGVPFAFPASPDTGEGLTPDGRALVRECNALRIMLDLSHLNEKGCDDVARLSDAPLVASHSCAHAIAPSSRNLTDRQLRQIAESGGLVGLNFASGFLRPDGKRLPVQGFDTMLRHLDHLLAILGEDGVALGSDFDGALMPADLPDAAALPRLIGAMQDHGYGSALVEKIAWRNWLSMLDRTWGG
ncbi:dipeptidase [Paracoccus endophyticus]|uniref:dipeptidase n=1 Tax=Paracoccus endophyticus TaxID=2233774 RepID=UPI000DD6D9D3|nr:dipeptidase [Paracoccus endophyticus]